MSSINGGSVIGALVSACDRLGVRDLGVLDAVRLRADVEALTAVAARVAAERLLCAHHHHAVHEGGRTVTGNADAVLTFHPPPDPPRRRRRPWLSCRAPPMGKPVRRGLCSSIDRSIE